MQSLSHIYKCVKCRRYRRTTEVRQRANLPEERTEASPPFTYCGLDCFGPFIVKEGRKELKRYGMLFTCLCSRAVHIETLDDLTTDAFMNALRTFIAIRGPVRQLGAIREQISWVPGECFRSCSREWIRSVNEHSAVNL